MNDLWERLSYGVGQLGVFLPAIIGALALLLAGYFVARQIEKWVDQTLARLDFNRVAREGGLADVMERAEPSLDPVHTVGKLAFWLVMLVVILLSSAALGLESINEMFGLLLGFLPTLISAIVIVILGIVVGEFLRGLILTSAGAVEGVPTLARVSKGVVVIIAVFMAVQQVGVAEEIVTTAFTLILGAVALGAGLAFGIGNTKLAGEITRRWYEEGRRPRTARTRATDREPPQAT
jgi:hypothetical protein